MSKAFTRESDDDAEESLPLPQRPALPPGTSNYMTPDGARRLREELDRLIQSERPAAAALPDPTTAKRQLKILDHRIQGLGESLSTAVVVDPARQNRDAVQFGASVTVRDRAGDPTTYRIVGIDETDLDRGWVSWLSPLARALRNARVGQRVRLKLPDGETELEIVRIEYE